MHPAKKGLPAATAPPHREERGAAAGLWWLLWARNRARCSPPPRVCKNLEESLENLGWQRKRRAVSCEGFWFGSATTRMRPWMMVRCNFVRQTRGNLKASTSTLPPPSQKTYVQRKREIRNVDHPPTNSARGFPRGLCSIPPISHRFRQGSRLVTLFWTKIVSFTAENCRRV